MDWRHKAICRDEDPELFFPVGNSGPALAQIAEAKIVCNRCPVTAECLTWALESGQDAGVWGGMSEDERRALKRRRARTRTTVCRRRSRSVRPAQRSRQDIMKAGSPPKEEEPPSVIPGPGAGELTPR